MLFMVYPTYHEVLISKTAALEKASKYKYMHILLWDMRQLITILIFFKLLLQILGNFYIICAEILFTN